MKLYTKPGACSLADHIVLRWSGLPFELVVIDAATMKSPEYLRLNPAGAVPLLLVDDWALTQNAAILNYIADIAPLTGLGGDGSARSRAEINRWIAFSNADVHPAFKPIFGSTAYLQDQALIALSHDDARSKLRTLYTRADAHLQDRQWLAGDSHTGADAYLFVTLRWAHKAGVDLRGLTALEAFFQRMQADTDVQAALTAEGLA
ncbi:glutathione S-transferase C-terminal domain-containing protein [Xanthomonas melonis]|uniref:Glutathione S-transferase n=1 Tax=Xanthomonas melonis TaxID=56456 RepID=A0A2S7DLB9_9XANT|nr:MULTISPECIES: glutathione S-transferase N-terminal domain-containing protein [Xanthomonas]MCC4586988.1 glutathione binding-like protein [Xanthomonas sp. NCPPB 1067]MCC4601384.1 glutathione binding-like protein [Xanthomonas melonis]MCD0246113.1 glutathione S-transferase C-terminal domain-containing protein [Xanthomonas melonis]MCD0259002.1 glutathione S-transferase C-terminal domain-containing protein [Xanthomonas melonis]MCD0267539.1 glutathione S-transferase C-terminal domain-containing pr